MCVGGGVRDRGIRGREGGREEGREGGRGCDRVEEGGMAPISGRKVGGSIICNTFRS